MGDGTAIQWADASWNWIVGCSVVSPGCKRCYAMREAYRFGFNPKLPQYAGLTEMTKAGPVWTGKVARASEETLLAPLHWKRPRRIFVNSMGDLFHEAIDFATIDRVYAIMLAAHWHTFLVLTKRADRQQQYMADPETPRRIVSASIDMGLWRKPIAAMGDWPLPNVWNGTSVEDQTRAEERLPHLVETPSAVLWVSAEPLLNGVDFERWLPHLKWIVIGGESGKGARPFYLHAARAIVEHCREAGVAVFCKQLGTVWARENQADTKGGDPAYWPDDLRVREFPNAI